MEKERDILITFFVNRVVSVVSVDDRHPYTQSVIQNVLIWYHHKEKQHDKTDDIGICGRAENQLWYSVSLSVGRQTHYMRPGKFQKVPKPENPISTDPIHPLQPKLGFTNQYPQRVQND